MDLLSYIYVVMDILTASTVTSTVLWITYHLNVIINKGGRDREGRGGEGRKGRMGRKKHNKGIFLYKFDRNLSYR